MVVVGGRDVLLKDAGGQRFDQPFAINATGRAWDIPIPSSGEEAVLWESTGTAMVLRTLAARASAKLSPSSLRA